MSQEQSLKFVDSHCHLDMLDLNDFDQSMDKVIDQAKAHNVTEMLSISVDLDSFPRVLATAKDYPNVYASVGLHPCHAPDSMISVDELVKLADDPDVIAIGETGLDYYMNDGTCPREEDFEWQKHRFRTHIQAGIATNKPLVIHTRDAKEDTLKILEQENASQCGAIMHCFVEDIPTAEKALELGFYISFSGIVTFKNARSIQEVAAMVPDNRLLIETDSPYLAPVPMRGKKNQPAYVSYIAEFLSELRNCSVEHIARNTRDNYFRLFNLNSG